MTIPPSRLRRATSLYTREALSAHIDLLQKALPRAGAPFDVISYSSLFVVSI